MKVELLEISNQNSPTGIGRYIRELHRNLRPLIPIEIKEPRVPRLTRHISFLKYLPVGILDHQPGSLVHYPQIMGCAMQLWNPYHPSVATVHDLGVLEILEERNAQDPVARLLLFLSLIGLKRMDLVISVSEFTRQTIINRLGILPHRVKAIHSGIDHSLFRPIPGARQKLIQKYPRLAYYVGPLLLYVGSELPRKNLLFLFEVVARIKVIYPNVALLKVGPPGNKLCRDRSLTAIRTHKIENQVEFLDAIKNEDLPLFYSAADVYLHPAQYEGFGFPVLEALACGTPVICSDAGALPEIVFEAAIKISPDNSESFSHAVCLMLEDNNVRDHYIELGLQRSAQFSWEKTAGIVVNTYNQLEMSNMEKNRNRLNLSSKNISPPKTS